MRREILEFNWTPHPNYFNVIKRNEIEDNLLIIGDVDAKPYIKTIVKNAVFKYEEIYDNGDIQVFALLGNEFKPIDSYRNHRTKLTEK